MRDLRRSSQGRQDMRLGPRRLPIGNRIAVAAIHCVEFDLGHRQKARVVAMVRDMLDNSPPTFDLSSIPITPWRLRWRLPLRLFLRSDPPADLNNIIGGHPGEIPCAA